MTADTTLGRASARLATISSIQRTRDDDRLRAQLAGGSVPLLCQRMAEAAQALQALADQLVQGLLSEG
jgi:hypothetical protein